MNAIDPNLDPQQATILKEVIKDLREIVTAQCPHTYLRTVPVSTLPPSYIGDRQIIPIKRFCQNCGKDLTNSL